MERLSHSIRIAFAVITLLVPTTLFANDLSEEATALLEKRCHMCHGAAMQMSKLDMRSREKLLTGGERGPAVTPTNLQRSLLWRFINHEAKPHMPPGEKLPDEEIDLIRRWIIAGAPMRETGRTPDEDAKLSALAKMEERPVTAEERSFWAFRNPVPTAPPTGRAEHPVDAFLLEAIEREVLQPAPPADRRTLVRRAYLDLLGLPPTPEQVAAFLADDSADAWPKLIDELLASPHYGERWGRHWLDLVRYADSGGFERDFDWDNAWRYRDYVVDAFNADKPYDRFIRDQIAGDEFHPGSAEARIATGYLRLGPDNNIKDERTRMDELDDLVSTTSQAYLGMTVGCARCHNHKFDPIPQKDYYQMQTVFFSTKGVEYPLVPESVVDAYDAEQKRIDGLEDPLKQRRAALEKPYRDRLFNERIEQLPDYMRLAWKTPAAERSEGQRLNARQIEKTLPIEEADLLAIMPEAERRQRETLNQAIKALDKQRPRKYATARTISEESRDPLPSYFLHRGSLDAKGSVMGPGILTVAAKDDFDFPEPPPEAPTSWRRRGFAAWISSAENPLTARVMVNRIWQRHFGEGIVRTPNNFGKTGAPPTHPKLLDWLAIEFIQRGWSVKAMHRLLITSEAYRRSSDDIAANLAIDSSNLYLWRMPRQRLEAEIIRDSMLAVAGTLDDTTGGPGVFPYIDPSLFQSSTERTWPGKAVGDTSTWRRSLYVFTKRSIRYPLFETFDQPDTFNSCARRNQSTTAPQALLLMNNAFVVLQAERFAARLQRDAGGDTAKQIERAYQLALARPPTEPERRAALKFINNNPNGPVDFCQTVFNLNEFVYWQ